MLQRLLIVFTEVKAFNTPENLRQILDKLFRATESMQ